MDEKMTWLSTWQHFLLGGYQEVKFLGQPQSLIQETWHLENSNVRHRLFPSCPLYRPLPQIASLVLGGNT